MAPEDGFEAFQRARELERIMRQAKGDGKNPADGAPDAPAPPARPRKIFRPRRRFRDAG